MTGNLEIRETKTNPHAAEVSTSPWERAPVGVVPCSLRTIRVPAVWVLLLPLPDRYPPAPPPLPFALLKACFPCGTGQVSVLMSVALGAGPKLLK